MCACTHAHAHADTRAHARTHTYAHTCTHSHAHAVMDYLLKYAIRQSTVAAWFTQSRLIKPQRRTQSKTSVSQTTTYFHIRSKQSQPTMVDVMTGVYLDIGPQQPWRPCRLSYKLAVIKVLAVAVLPVDSWWPSYPSIHGDRPTSRLTVTVLPSTHGGCTAIDSRWMSCR